MSRLFAIGDVDGCERALSSLLNMICPTPDDTVVQLGDLVDRGPDSAGAVNRMIALQSECHVIQLLGDHEELMLDAIDDHSKLARWQRNGGDSTLQSYGLSAGDHLRSISTIEEHVEYLKEGVDYFEAEQHVFVHAGFVAHLPWKQQPQLALRWRVAARDVTQPHCSGKTVICGHSAQTSGDVLKLDRVWCIDTNCVHGGWLTALEVNSGRIWQVDRDGDVRN